MTTDSSHCKFVSADGICRSCFSEGIPYSSSFSDDLKRYSRDCLPGRPFVFVTGFSDTKVPDQIPFASDILSNPNCRAWFTQNYGGGRAKMRRIPIGLDYHTLSAGNAPKLGPKATAIEQERELLEIIQSAAPMHEREVRGYSDSHLTRGWIPERKKALELAEQSAVNFAAEWIPRTQAWRKMSEHAFVLSPWGVGMDCHRTWEALVLGAVPIVNMSSMNSMFDGLPVWFVYNWRDVTMENMHKVLDQFRTRTFDMSRLTLKYWMNQIRSALTE